MSKIKYTLYSSLIIILLMGGCKESLPPYNTPSHVFSTRTNFTYEYSPTANYFLFQIFFTNVFDETLEDTIDLEGNFIITPTRDLNRSKTVQLDPGFIESTSMYDPKSGIITIDPGKSIELRYIWDFSDDSGNKLTDSFFNFYVDPECIQRMRTPVEDYVVKGKARLTKHGGDLLIEPKVFSSPYFVPFVGPHDCGKDDTISKRY